MRTGPVAGQTRHWPPAQLQADLDRALARNTDLLITGRLGAGRTRAAEHAQVLLDAAGVQSQVIHLESRPTTAPVGRCIFVGEPTVRPGDFPDRSVTHVIAHAWTLDELVTAFPTTDARILSRLHADTAGHYAYLAAWNAAGRPVQAIDPQIWQHVVDRALSTLSRSAAALAEELACGFRVMGTPPAPSLAGANGDPAALMTELDNAALLAESGELLPAAVVAIDRRLAPYRRHLLRREFLGQLTDPSAHEDLLLRWAENGASDPSLTNLLVGLGEQARWREPAQALRCYAAAGRSPDVDDVRQAGIAETALLLGDRGRARDAAEAVLTGAPCPARARALRVAEDIWTAKGRPGLAAELNDRYATDGSLVQHAGWFLTQLRVGNLAAARSRWTQRSSTTPTTIDEIACIALVDALDASVTSERSNADDAVIERLADLGPELSVECRVTTDWAGVVTALALAAGRAPAAARMLAALDGAPDFTPDHQVLTAWAELRSGRAAQAASLFAEIPTDTLTPRGDLLASGLALALAQHTNDRNALVAGWPAMVAAIGQCEPDLFGLIAHADLMVAAARLREGATIRQAWAAAHDLLGRLEFPAVWSNLVDWAQIQAAILTDRPDEIRDPAQRLRRSADHSPQAAVLATAGRIWIDVLAKSFDPKDVLSAAQNLAQVGVPLDGARLASHAAARCEDDLVRRDLLEMARLTHQIAVEPAGSHSSVSALRLSAREVQVASLVVQHRSYREIGETLFLSPRTVENHVARMRRRAGARTRRELLDQLREALRDLGHVV